MRPFLVVALLMVAVMAGSPAIAQDKLPPGVLKSEFVYETAPFPSCHASTIAETAKGTLVAAWFGGKYEKHPEVGVWV